MREAIIEERMNLYELLIPSVSKKEMSNIETLYKNPSQYDKKNFKDATDWVMKWKLISVITLWNFLIRLMKSEKISRSRSTEGAWRNSECEYRGIGKVVVSLKLVLYD